MDKNCKIKTIRPSKITKRYFNINPCLEDNIIVKCKKKKKYKIIGQVFITYPIIFFCYYKLNLIDMFIFDRIFIVINIINIVNDLNKLIVVDF